MTKLISSIFFWTGLLISLPLFSQGEANNWFFGENAGLHFNSDGSVTPLSTGKLQTLEGCSSISDSSGNLLFYTDGSTVYNRNHNVMLNGTNLYGDVSSTQSAIIVPKPEFDNIYYIFTVDTSVGQNDPDFGFNYSVVDMSADNGLGAITIKNQSLLANCSEKLSAVVKDCRQKTFWVVTMGFNSPSDQYFNAFYAYEVSSAGIGNPVKSVISGSPIEDQRGYLKFSPDGTKLAAANAVSGLTLFDFDATSGTVSNRQTLSSVMFPYGLEFSPNNRFLYVHSSNDQFQPPHDSYLTQYDLDAANISTSRVILDRRNIYRGALQLGPNGKIYRTISNDYTEGTNYLGVIENPDQPNATYTHNAIYLGVGHLATQGLPPFVQSFFNKVNLIPQEDSTLNNNDLELCENDSYLLEAPEYTDATYKWYLNDELLSETGNTLEIVAAGSEDEGIYRVDIDPIDLNECPITGEAIVTVNVLPQTVALELIQCDVDANPTDGLSDFNLTELIPQIGTTDAYTIDFFDSATSLTADTPITNPGNYRNTSASQMIIYRISQGDCYRTGTAVLNTNSTAVAPAAIPYFFQCEDLYAPLSEEADFDLDAIKQDLTSGYAAFYENTEDAILEVGELSGSLRVTSEKTLYVRYETDDACTAIEYITLIVDQRPNATLEEPLPLICLNTPRVTVNITGTHNEYRWYRINPDGTENLLGNERYQQISEPGDYRIEVADQFEDHGVRRTCTGESFFTINASNIATFSAPPEIFDISENNTITVFTEGEGDYEYALYSIDGPYQESNVFENVPPGFITIFVRDKNGCGTIEKTVSVIGYDKFFTPNNDGINDHWQLKGINAEFQTASLIFIYDRYGKLLKQIDPLGPGWDGTFHGNILPASDYWFRVQLEDGREFKGHFTLKR
ncbi:T9SS type B sorting domain-containing protein [Robertkochia solimangrovi]|uniref:T9SS type B sorting domain-containing protein n=1 Tax=Robertkochia solimangrovi TaxID=2213046 RepID=UPI00117EF4F1|nr:T9SS type B sorting domain-containing protein [Robertkochia solimangrovi]TRZ42780.1 hypothetical protein DMZ48_11960 [Robertkochia solimangrovi]